ncbi:site-specific recombinase XerC [Desmospora profundinema]|uniref:Site-specific recombinase XerC n=1 Tax=Desmospora profundinema TaxID=1571184 RepID=A0ABU1IQ82_9BACL|nr:site-specific recombinase XerC [Desmospora profundinema]
MRRKRVTARAASTENTQQRKLKLELNAAFEYFISAKKGEGLRDRTIKDYSNAWRYFCTWMVWDRLGENRILWHVL